MVELTAFQLSLLATIADNDEPSGQTIMRELEGHYESMHGDNINHGRLYPNLDALVEAGVATKGEKDARTNYYAITDGGVAMLKQRTENLERGL